MLPPAGFEPATPGLRDQCSTTELKRRPLLIFWSCTVTRISPIGGSVAEWSKALVLGTSLSGRGFESHRCHENILYPVPCWSGLGIGYNCANVARLAEWSKAWDLSSHNRKIAWVRTPHLANDVLPALFDLVVVVHFSHWKNSRIFVIHLLGN